MTLSDLDRLLHATLPAQSGLMSVTVTDFPPHDRSLRDLIAKAREIASLKQTPLVAVEFATQLYPRAAAEHGDLELRDCGQADVLRFVYDCTAAMA